MFSGLSDIFSYEVEQTFYMFNGLSDIFSYEESVQVFCPVFF